VTAQRSPYEDRQPAELVAARPSANGQRLGLEPKYNRLMVFANAGTLGTLPGRRDELVALHTQRSDLLRELGCTAYEVGVNDDESDTVFVIEVWNSEEGHRRSLEHPEAQASIASARPLLSGQFGGFRFNVVGSPPRLTTTTRRGRRSRWLIGERGRNAPRQIGGRGFAGPR